MKPNRSLDSILEEMTMLNKIHQRRGNKRLTMTRHYEEGRYKMLVSLLKKKEARVTVWRL